MRKLRERPQDRSSYIRVSCTTTHRDNTVEFGDIEKDELFTLLNRLRKFYKPIEVLSFVALDDGYDSVIYVPIHRLPLEKVVRYHDAYYRGRWMPLDLTDENDREVAEHEAERMHNFSHFFSEINQQFTTWYNRERAPGRGGTVWKDRFKSRIIESSSLLWDEVREVEMLPVQRGYVLSPDEYPFSSWGKWHAGSHPFVGSFHKHLKRSFGTKARSWTVDMLQKQLLDSISS